MKKTLLSEIQAEDIIQAVQIEQLRLQVEAIEVTTLEGAEKWWALISDVSPYDIVLSDEHPYATVNHKEWHGKIALVQRIVSNCEDVLANLPLNLLDEASVLGKARIWQCQIATLHESYELLKEAESNGWLPCSLYEVQEKKKYVARGKTAAEKRRARKQAIDRGELQKLTADNIYNMYNTKQMHYLFWTSKVAEDFQVAESTARKVIKQLKDGWRIVNDNGCYYLANTEAFEFYWKKCKKRQRCRLWYLCLYIAEAMDEAYGVKDHTNEFWERNNRKKRSSKNA